jgi:hypothetical protein
VSGTFAVLFRTCLEPLPSHFDERSTSNNRFHAHTVQSDARLYLGFRLARLPTTASSRVVFYEVIGTVICMYASVYKDYTS